MCMFCQLGICIVPAHAHGAPLARFAPVDDELPPLLDDEEIPLFDVTGRTTRRLMAHQRSLATSAPVQPLSLAEIRRREDEQTEAYFEERRIPYPSQTREAEILTSLLGIAIGRPNLHAIPKIIHRFWTGGPLRQGALQQLLTAGAAARRNGWRCHFWYSTTIEDMVDTTLTLEKQRLRQSQRDQLEAAGYEIGFVEGLAPPRRRGALQFVDEDTVIEYARVAARSVINYKDYDVVKYFSDFARLLYLHALGGFHIDVDMGLGDMDLTCNYYHNDAAGEVPLLGTLARDSSNVRVARPLSALRAWCRLGTASREGYHEAARLLADTATMGACMFNGLIASRPNTRHCRLAIIGYQDKAKSLVRNGGLPTGMALQATLLCGSAGNGALDLAMRQSVPPYVFRLDQITDESDIGAGLRPNGR